MDIGGAYCGFKGASNGVPAVCAASLHRVHRQGRMTFQAMFPFANFVQTYRCAQSLHG
jgi:hypothetical protein